jgi:hypothetical protein
MRGRLTADLRRDDAPPEQPCFLAFPLRFQPAAWLTRLDGDRTIQRDEAKRAPLAHAADMALLWGVSFRGGVAFHVFAILPAVVARHGH